MQYTASEEVSVKAACFLHFEDGYISIPWSDDACDFKAPMVTTRSCGISVITLFSNITLS